MNQLSVSLTVGQVSAILTSLEFIIGGLALLQLPRLVSKILFLRRKSNGGLISQDSLRQVRIFIQFLGFFITVLLTICITLVEFNLERKQIFSSKLYSTTRWIDFLNNPTNLSADTPDIMFTEVGQLSIDAVRQINCSKGINSIAFGVPDDSNGDESPYIYPECIPKADVESSKQDLYFEHRFHRSKIDIQIGPAGGELVSGYMTALNDNSSWITIIPESSNNFSFKHSNFVSPNLSICAQKNITLAEQHGFAGPCGHYRFGSTSANRTLDIRDTSTNKINRAMIQKVCELHTPTTSNSANISMHNVTNCLHDRKRKEDNRYKFKLDINCIRRKIRRKLPNLAKTVNFSGVTVVASSGIDIKGTVCTNATVELNYAILPDLFFLKTELRSTIFVPMQWTVTSGQCESVSSLIGLYAASFSAIDEFMPEKVSKTRHLTRQERLHAYILSLARNQFPYEYFLKFDPERNAIRTFHISNERTIIVTGISFFFMIILTIFLRTNRFNEWSTIFIPSEKPEEENTDYSKGIETRNIHRKSFDRSNRLASSGWVQDK